MRQAATRPTSHPATGIQLPHAAGEPGVGEEAYGMWPKQAGYAVKIRDNVLKRGASGG